MPSVACSLNSGGGDSGFLSPSSPTRRSSLEVCTEAVAFVGGDCAASVVVGGCRGTTSSSGVAARKGGSVKHADPSP